MHDWDVMTCIMLSVRNDLNSSAKYKTFFHFVVNFSTLCAVFIVESVETATGKPAISSEKRSYVQSFPSSSRSGVTSFCTQGWGGDVSAIRTQNIPLNLSKRGFIKRG